MAVITNAPRGTQDILPAVSTRWLTVEATLRHAAELYGFLELRTPVFEHTELFSRSVGDTTDVVQKEMYTFMDKGDRSLTLRPEGTAGAVRAILQNGLLGGALPLKVSYCISCFRYEKPQAGRLREFHQFGAEVIGPKSPAADAELIALASDLLETLGISDVRLELNSIGCPVCRGEYHSAMQAFFSERKEQLCPTCQERLEKNPMRILDCKNPECGKITADAPMMLSFLCGECSEHFQELKARLDALSIDYQVNPRIVRGLDYYTKTVFEFISQNIGAQGTILGGGRYDGLIEQLGGAPTPALGFAMGIERLLLVMEASGVEWPQAPRCDLYIAPMGEEAAKMAQTLCTGLRQSGFFAESDLMGRSLKAQMKYADKIGARHSVVLGESELSENQCLLKNMADGTTRPIALDKFGEQIMAIFLEEEYTGILDAGNGPAGKDC